MELSKKILFTSSIFIVGILAVILTQENEVQSYSQNSILFIIAMIFGICFLCMGVYSIITGRVYGRTWKTYWGGWLNRTTDTAYYYWGYTFMYIISGALLLLGCQLFI